MNALILTFQISFIIGFKMIERYRQRNSKRFQGCIKTKADENPHSYRFGLSAYRMMLYL